MMFIYTNTAILCNHYIKLPTWLFIKFQQKKKVEAARETHMYFYSSLRSYCNQTELTQTNFIDRAA